MIQLPSSLHISGAAIDAIGTPLKEEEKKGGGKRGGGKGREVMAIAEFFARASESRAVK